ncbi:hypothetical protein HMPREF9999_02264 [Alloprevotella sp. oral taxon 473 str. F0040]|nr:hypothetical protein HMPREF9999_02264 [Alloprevotella sp. oral taxon 473 str. F0040]
MISVKVVKAKSAKIAVVRAYARTRERRNIERYTQEKKTLSLPTACSEKTKKKSEMMINLSDFLPTKSERFSINSDIIFHALT